MKKPENVIDFYVLCNKLKNVIRTGWQNWNVKADRLESVAEHIYGTQMLAIAMKSEYGYDVDIYKVVLMLAIHELEEIVIGDLTLFDIDKNEKEKLGHEAIEKVLGNLIDKEKLKDIILEFDAKETKEAKFSYFCDKLECDLQCKLYGERKLVDLNKQSNNKSFFNEDVQEYLKENKTWEEMWLLFSQGRYGYDKNFMEVSNYALHNKIDK